MYRCCRECKRLWEELSDATKMHIAILGKAQLAEIEQNNAALSELEGPTMAAAERRGRARMAFREHQATHRSPRTHIQTA
jgi:hypothetical protein